MTSKVEGTTSEAATDILQKAVENKTNMCINAVEVIE